MISEPPWAQASRDSWGWRGQARPPFAVLPAPGQTSVWDFPRPPRLAPDDRELVVRWGGVEVARTRQAIRVLETAHPPSFYLPWRDVARDWLEPAPGANPSPLAAPQAGVPQAAGTGPTSTSAGVPSAPKAKTG